MRGSRLQGLVILHHSLDGVGIHGARKTFVPGLFALHHGHRHVLFSETSVEIEDCLGLLHRLGFRGVNRMPLLPEKFRGAQKEPGPQLPANHVGPLVDQDRQIPIGLNPLGIGLTDDRLTGRPDDQGLFQLARRLQPPLGIRFEAMMGNDSAFLREALDVLGFPFQVAHRNKQRKVGVDVPSLLEHPIKNTLHVFPDGITPGLNHHTAAHRRHLGKLCGLDDLLIPLRVIFRSHRGDGVLLFLSHCSYPRGCPRDPLSNRSARHSPESQEIRLDRACWFSAFNQRNPISFDRPPIVSSLSLA